MVARKLETHGLHNLQNHRVVLTGGGSQLPGMREVANLILNKQVRLGGPRNIGGLPEPLANNPIFATSLGMLLFATNNIECKPKKVINRPLGGNKLMKIFNWIKQNS